jgi:hypothetical protein
MLFETWHSQVLGKFTIYQALVAVAEVVERREKVVFIDASAKHSDVGAAVVQ